MNSGKGGGGGREGDRPPCPASLAMLYSMAYIFIPLGGGGGRGERSWAPSIAGEPVGGSLGRPSTRRPYRTRILMGRP